MKMSSKPQYEEYGFSEKEYHELKKLRSSYIKAITNESKRDYIKSKITPLKQKKKLSSGQQWAVMLLSNEFVLISLFLYKNPSMFSDIREMVALVGLGIISFPVSGLLSAPIWCTILSFYDNSKEEKRFSSDYQHLSEEYDNRTREIYGPYLSKFEDLDRYDKDLKAYNYEQQLLDIEFWKRMNGREFEEAVTKLFIENGFSTTLTKTGPDGGIDIYARKDGKKYGIQCKAHKTKISESVVRDLYGTLISKDMDGGYIVTINGLSSVAEDFIKNKTKYIKIHSIQLKDILSIKNRRKRIPE